MASNNLWLKIRIWTKVTIAAIVALYVLIFIIKNSGEPAQFWYWYNREIEASLLLLVFFAFMAGVVVTLLVRTIWHTVRQIRESRERGRTERLEREVEEMKSKAAMLRTRLESEGQQPPPQ